MWMIRDQELRQLVESDWAEFEKVCDRHLLKAGLVLAGSITEALLMNHLEVIGYRTPKGRSPRTMSLGLMLEACVAKGDLSPDVEALCRVLKDYRDLVHPGRVLRERLKPNWGQLNVAKQAVERVVGDLQDAAFQRPEWAADVFFNHALYCMTGGPSERTLQLQIRRLAEEQRDRLIAEVVPQRILEASGPHASGLAEEILQACRICLRSAWSYATAESRQRAASAVAAAVAQAAEFDMQEYCDALIGDLLDYLSTAVRDEVIEEILSAMPSQLRRGVTPAIEGLGQYLRPEQVETFVDPLARCAVRRPDDEKLAGLARWAGRTLVAEAAAMSNDDRRRVVSVLDTLVEKAHGQEAARAAEGLAAMRFQIEPVAEDDIPRS